MRSIAVPLDAGPVRALRREEDLWQVATEHPPFRRPPVPRSRPPITRELLAVLPSDADWVEHFGDRSFDQAEYLLDPAAARAPCTWAERERTLAHRIVHGDEVFAAHALSAQGMTWRCSTAAFLAEAADEIDTLPLDARRAEFSVAEMTGLGIYKVAPDEDDDHAFTRVLAGLREHAARCRHVADRGLGLIVELW